MRRSFKPAKASWNEVFKASATVSRLAFACADRHTLLIPL